MRIGVGLAKGLTYLQNEANPRVIYKDLKPRNVLLVKEYHPKISDFGIAISAPSNDRSSSVTVTQLMGTPPYWAPEGALTDRLSPKSDVYSFGVLLLEIIAGTVPLDSRRPRYVADWVTLQILINILKDNYCFFFSFLFIFKSCIMYNICVVRHQVMRKENFVGLADREMNGLFPEEELIKAMTLASQCMKLHLASRPDICADV
ncbi:serine/threonine-protein kinase pbs1 [Phtheirospermum japonicum]|uniref:Serine/threonine-protein kinase pbs1 n=1 Tax=Phtheirospermum japonicum TaxID=374723 RepID=A0A830BPW1_9LAMI|nr:serine/threonine-protein kinase pbs1 [Phtheirospermum japonicum]